MQSISTYISNSLDANIEETINISGAYDFNMSTDKFQSEYNFNFDESIESIVNELVDKDNNYSNRNIYIKYE